MSLIQRNISESVVSFAGSFPVLVVTGPRQAGKTTLTKMLFPEYAYVSPETPNEPETE